jgi:hypothetical protein
VNVAAIGLDANNANNSASQWVAGNSYVTPQYQYGNTYNYGSTYPTAYYPSQSYTSYYTPTTPTPAYNQYYVGYNQPTYSGY